MEKNSCVILHDLEELLDVVSGADLVVQTVELVEGEILGLDGVGFAARQFQIGETLVHQLLRLARGECACDHFDRYFALSAR